MVVITVFTFTRFLKPSQGSWLQLTTAEGLTCPRGLVGTTMKTKFYIHICRSYWSLGFWCLYYFLHPSPEDSASSFVPLLPFFKWETNPHSTQLTVFSTGDGCPSILTEIGYNCVISFKFTWKKNFFLDGCRAQSLKERKNKAGFIPASQRKSWSPDLEAPQVIQQVRLRL